jgi:hypothetical protein
LLGDAIDAWKPVRVSSWHVENGRGRWEETLDLRQVKKGTVPIPSVKIRCRDNANAEWQEAEWTDVLTDIHGLPLPLKQSPAKPINLLWAGAGVAAALTVVGVGIFIWRQRKRPAAKLPTPEERALTQLARLKATIADPTHDPREFSEALSTLLRRFLVERFALSALRQTTAEFRETLSKTTAIAENCRELLPRFLERCDLIKFAGVAPSAEECQEMATFVRTFIQDSTQALNSVTAPVTHEN